MGQRAGRVGPTKRPPRERVGEPRDRPPRRRAVEPRERPPVPVDLDDHRRTAARASARPASTAAPTNGSAATIASGSNSCSSRAHSERQTQRGRGRRRATSARPVRTGGSALHERTSRVRCAEDPVVELLLDRVPLLRQPGWEGQPVSGAPDEQDRRPSHSPGRLREERLEPTIDRLARESPRPMASPPQPGGRAGPAPRACAASLPRARLDCPARRADRSPRHARPQERRRPRSRRRVHPPTAPRPRSAAGSPRHSRGAPPWHRRRPEARRHAAASRETRSDRRSLVAASASSAARSGPSPTTTSRASGTTATAAKAVGRSFASVRRPTKTNVPGWQLLRPHVARWWCRVRQNVDPLSRQAPNSAQSRRGTRSARRSCAHAAGSRCGAL